MMPRLLSKRDVDLKKAQERQTALDEGGKLARTVDSLRELRANEEKTFEDWRIGTLSSIQKEVDALHIRRTVLIGEVKTLEELKRKAKEPMDEQWKELNEAEVQVQQAILQLTESKNNLELAIAANIQRERNNEVETQRIADERHRTTEALIRVQVVLKEAREESESMSNRSQIKMAEADLRIEEVGKREADVIEREKKAAERWELVENYERKLVEREVALKDGWKTLLETKKEQ